MASTGYQEGSSFSSDGVGGTAWSNPSNAQSNDGSYATATVWSNYTTEGLEATGFGFSGLVPSGATIDGIQVEVNGGSDGGSTAFLDINMSLIGHSGTSDDKSTGGHWGSSHRTVEYGGASDLWGITWASAGSGGSDVHNTGFGTNHAWQRDGSSTKTAQYDSVRINVYYTAAGGGGATVNAATGAVVFTDPIPSVTASQATEVISPASTMLFGAKTPQVASGASLTASKGIALLDSLEPSVAAGASISAGTGAVLLSNPVPGVSAGKKVASPVSSLIFQGKSPTISVTGPVEIESPSKTLLLGTTSPRVITEAGRRYSVSIGKSVSRNVSTILHDSVGREGVGDFDED